MQSAQVEESAVGEFKIWEGRYGVNIKTGMFESGELHLEISRVDIEYFYARSIVNKAGIGSGYPFIDDLVSVAKKTFDLQEISELTRYFVKLPDTKIIISPAHIPTHDTLEKWNIDSLFWDAGAYDGPPFGVIPFYKMLNYDLEFNVHGFFNGDKHKDFYRATYHSKGYILGIDNPFRGFRKIEYLDGSTMCFIPNISEMN